MFIDNLQHLCNSIIFLGFGNKAPFIAIIWSRVALWVTIHNLFVWMRPNIAMWHRSKLWWGLRRHSKSAWMNQALRRSRRWVTLRLSSTSLSQRRMLERTGVMEFPQSIVLQAPPLLSVWWRPCFLALQLVRTLRGACLLGLIKEGIVLFPWETEFFFSS